LILLTACSKDRSIETSQDKLNTSFKTSNSPETTQNTIHILSSGFSPDSLTVHTVTSEKSDSGDIPPGGIFKFGFDNTGMYVYFCKYHAAGGVIVVAGIR